MDPAAPIGPGWTLLSNGGLVCPWAGITPLTNLTLTSCGYVTEERVRVLANSATSVMLMWTNFNGPLDTTTRWSAVYTSDMAGVMALRMGGNWQNNSDMWQGDTANWCWRTACTPPPENKWPNMYHSCGYHECVHWIVLDSPSPLQSLHYRQYRADYRSATLIR